MLDYWTDLHNEDLMPCGFMDYWVKMNGSIPYSGMKPNLQPPKGRQNKIKSLRKIFTSEVKIS